MDCGTAALGMITYQNESHDIMLAPRLLGIQSNTDVVVYLREMLFSLFELSVCTSLLSLLYTLSGTVWTSKSIHNREKG